RAATGSVTKRFAGQGVKVESGPKAGRYFYTKDHLGSVRELVDNAGLVRARFAYEPFGRRTQTSGDVNSDFGFTGWLYHDGHGLSLARYRAYEAENGRWLSRDPLANSTSLASRSTRGRAIRLAPVELLEGPNLYTYVHNNPVSHVDPLGLWTLCF